MFLQIISNFILDSFHYHSQIHWSFLLQYISCHYPICFFSKFSPLEFWLGSSLHFFFLYLLNILNTWNKLIITISMFFSTNSMPVLGQLWLITFLITNSVFLLLCMPDKLCLDDGLLTLLSAGYFFTSHKYSDLWSEI